MRPVDVGGQGALGQGRSMTTQANQPDSPPSWLFPLGVSLALLATFVASVVSLTGLYADGANYFLEIIASRTWFHPSPFRVGATSLTQLPVLAALALGSGSISVLAALQTAGLIAIPTLCYMATTWLTRTSTLGAIANTVVICCVYYPTAFESVGEFHLLYALFWLSSVIAVSLPRPGWLGVAVLALSAVVMPLSYELGIVTGPCLALTCLFRAVRFPGGLPRWAWLGLAVASVACVPVAIAGILTPQDGGAEAAFASALKHAWKDPTLLGLAAVVLCSALACTVRSRRYSAIAFAAAVGVALVFGYSALRTHADTDLLALGYQNTQRAQVFPYLLGAFALLVAAQHPAVKGGLGARPLWPLLIPIGLVCALHLSEVAAWRSYMSSFCTDLAGPGAPSGRDAFLATDGARRFGWNWELPTMSVLLRPSDSHRLISDPSYTGWQPKDRESKAPLIARFKRSGGLCR